MRRSVYIETTIPSYYVDDRAALHSDIERTRTWWNDERRLYDCAVSLAVLEELSAGEYPGKPEALRLVRGLPLAPASPAALDLAMAYQAALLMPRLPNRDAIHVAIATVNRFDYVLTWNCRHIANANKLRALELFNARLGYATPLLVTPAVLLPWEPNP